MSSLYEKAIRLDGLLFAILIEWELKVERFAMPVSVASGEP